MIFAKHEKTVTIRAVKEKECLKEFNKGKFLVFDSPRNVNPAGNLSYEFALN